MDEAAKVSERLATISKNVLAAKDKAKQLWDRQVANGEIRAELEPIAQDVQAWFSMVVAGAVRDINKKVQDDTQAAAISHHAWVAAAYHLQALIDSNAHAIGVMESIEKIGAGVSGKACVK